jgi:hypothetical protein
VEVKQIIIEALNEFYSDDFKEDKSISMRHINFTSKDYTFSFPAYFGNGLAPAILQKNISESLTEASEYITPDKHYRVDEHGNIKEFD